MPHEVIMPALGMAQDTGLIVAWHKAPGDAVAAGDILFEVETDKATMEVESSFDGYVAALLAEVGEEAPVGDVIAVISTEKPEKPIQTSLAGKAGPTPKPIPTSVATTPEKAVEEGPTPVKKPMKAGASSDSLILASPKARRLALKLGLDLSGLAAAGYPQPYHVADLETLKALSVKTVVAGASAASHVTARVPRDGFLGFQRWLANAGVVSDETIFVAFAAASLRAATRAEAVIVRGDQPTLGLSTFFADPDLRQLSKVTPSDEGSPSLILRDLTASRVTGGAFGTGEIPMLTIAMDGDYYVLTLDFALDLLGADIAIQFLDGFAKRLDEPLRHLL